MSKSFWTLVFLLLCTAVCNAESYHVTPYDSAMGTVVKRVWLERYEVPVVTLTGVQFTPVSVLPRDVTIRPDQKVKIVMGEERKRPFAIIYVPVYNRDANGLKKITDFDIAVTQSPAASPTSLAKMTSGSSASNSVLVSGTWYKIAVPATGLYKIDGNFLKKMGIDISNLKSSDIRVFGYGGNMLFENNAMPGKDDLAENAIMVSDGGDGIFNAGDYFVFYGQGPVGWVKDSVNQRFNHRTNLYSDSGYYFISVNNGAGLRINAQGNAPIANTTVTTVNDYAVHELELYNPGHIGQQWYGEQFTSNPGQSLSRNFNFTFNSVPDSVHVYLNVGSVSSDDNNLFNIVMNGTGIRTLNLPAVQSTSDVFDPVETDFINNDFPLNNASVNFSITYQPGSSSTANIGYLDFIELNVRRPLAISATQMNFRDWRSAGPGNVAMYVMEGAGNNTMVWDVTTPQAPVYMNVQLNGGSTLTFSREADVLHEFVAMNSTDLPAPAFSGTVANQNLHGNGQVDLVIVAHPSFIDAAQQLADFHRQADHLRVIVATTIQVYNEFGSGSQDVCAIRDFAKMFFNRAGSDTTQMPKYLLLFGGASYDYKDRVANNCNFVATYETPFSHSNIDCYCSDDFFGTLDSTEDINNETIFNTVDVGVGRIPARNVSDALAFVSKAQNYRSPASLGPWRISSTFVGDKEDPAGCHLNDADSMAKQVEDVSNNIQNETKVYVDAIPIIITPAGARCPNANATINNNVYKGTFLINYSGHGNTQVWSNERVLTQDDYNNWNNPDALPFTITAACDFGQYDQPSFVSAGEALVMRNNGGVIAALTTTQSTYADANHIIDFNYLGAQMVKYPGGHFNTFGDAFSKGKNLTYSTVAGGLENFRKFVLLGDPALIPDIPYYNVRNDSITDGVTMTITDSVKALGTYRIYGSVTDFNNNVLNDFNGTVTVALYDKIQKIIVPVYDQCTGGFGHFNVQNNTIYKGKATVTNGRFSYVFIAPKDINYNFGYGKISSYAENGVTDAAGADSGMTVGGFSDNPVNNTIPPIVRPFIGDSLFINGGITGPNTLLYVLLSSPTGINVSGNDVGHDLIGTLDGQSEAPYILNDYYETLPNSYQKGVVSFPVKGLADGPHSITVRAWDVNDNFSEGTVNFVVVSGTVVQISGLMNYPNPFSNITHFVFEHNHPDEPLNVQVEIYNTSGVLVHELKQAFTPSGSRTDEITWDATDAGGAKLPSGVYVYRLKLSTASGISATGYQKLVLIR